MNAYKKSRINNQVQLDDAELNVGDKNAVVALSCNVIGNMPDCIASKNIKESETSLSFKSSDDCDDLFDKMGDNKTRSNRPSFMKAHNMLTKEKIFKHVLSLKFEKKDELLCNFDFYGYKFQ